MNVYIIVGVLIIIVTLIVDVIKETYYHDGDDEDGE